MRFRVKIRNFGTDFSYAYTVVVRSIIAYLAQERRLVIPQLGTFLVKEAPGGASDAGLRDGVPGEGLQGRAAEPPAREIVFSAYWQDDDGVLRRVLRSDHGLSEIEAAGLIDRFVYEVPRTRDLGRTVQLSVMTRCPSRYLRCHGAHRTSTVGALSGSSRGSG